MDALLVCVTGEDKQDEGLDNIPSIRNIKSRFEVKDESPPIPIDRTRSSVRRCVSHYSGFSVCLLELCVLDM